MECQASGDIPKCSGGSLAKAMLLVELSSAQVSLKPLRGADRWDSEQLAQQPAHMYNEVSRMGGGTSRNKGVRNNAN